ncbi:T9SS type A sorting domain-containing protein [Portibacter lacus]|uniref:Secretion system C-terminal sorting domain-containing protein n=1 Tax=Portibacter lacus TaxID=1099794 RepID=A0AA37WHL1_9BACT|nr:T9SS type A sorting domain-containing protein [Portibacter lacus]GLR19514.1 hypothetical protein GCM10007940_41300 [Portibacter lacus]
MKLIKLFPIIFLFAFSPLSSQSIFDFGEPLIIEDMISFENSIYSFWIVGTCMEGSLINHLESPSFIAGYGFTLKARLKKNESKWAALSVNRQADDVGPNFVSLSYHNEDKFVEKKTIDGILDFKDFSIFQDSLIAILTEDDKLKFYDFEGGLFSEVVTELSLESIEAHDNHVLGFSKNGFYLIDGNGEKNGSVDLVESIKTYFIDNESIYIGLEDRIEIYDGGLNLSSTIAFEKGGTIEDILVFKNDLFILSVLEEQSSVYKIDENNVEEKVFVEDNAVQDFNRLITNGSSVYIYGHQTTEGEKLTNGIFENISNPSPSEKDVSIDLNEIVQIPDTFEVHEQLDGTLVYEIYYHYELQFGITNLSDKKVDEIFVLSNRMHGFNCAYAQLQIKLKNLNLEPGGQITIDTLYKAYRKYNELCLYAIAVDGEVDADFSNNSTCKLVLSADASSFAQKVKIYPNPTADVLTFDGIPETSKVRVLNISGKVISTEMQRYGSKMDVSSLPAGIYILEIVDQDKKLYIDKFVKL